MNDVTKCHGIDSDLRNCKKKEKCFRYVSPKAEYQWWTFVENVNDCELYIPLEEKYKK